MRACVGVLRRPSPGVHDSVCAARHASLSVVGSSVKYWIVAVVLQREPPSVTVPVDVHGSNRRLAVDVARAVRQVFRVADLAHDHVDASFGRKHGAGGCLLKLRGHDLRHDDAEHHDRKHRGDENRQERRDQCRARSSAPASRARRTRSAKNSSSWLTHSCQAHRVVADSIASSRRALLGDSEELLRAMNVVCLRGDVLPAHAIDLQVNVSDWRNTVARSRGELKGRA